MANTRTYYALEHLHINGPSGLTSPLNKDYDMVNGVQSIGVNTNFNITPVYQLGQVGAYDLFGDIPENEISITRVIDGYPCLYGMAMGNNRTLQDAADYRVGLRIFCKSEDGGSLVSAFEYMPSYLSNVSFNFPVDGDFTEEVTFVSNNARALSTSVAVAEGTVAGPDTSTPAGRKTSPLLLGRRGTMDINASNFPGKTGNTQSISISFDLGREALNRLGQRAPFTRYINFPVEITTEITYLYEGGGAGGGSDVPDSEQCVASSVDADTTIKVALCDGSVFDVGNNNAVQSSNVTGGDAGGDNKTISVTYISYSYFKYTFPNSTDSSMGTLQSDLSGFLDSGSIIESSYPT